MDPHSTEVGGEAAVLEQLHSLQNRKNDQLEHIQGLTTQFREWRLGFNSALESQSGQMRLMRTTLAEESAKQRVEFEQMQAELERQLNEVNTRQRCPHPAPSQRPTVCRARAGCQMPTANTMAAMCLVRADYD